MERALASLLLVTASVTPLLAQDTEFIRALERAQAQRPGSLQSNARIAPASEPGTPLVIHGRVFSADGRTPVGGAIVFAYHTDREGLYDKAGSPPHSWRLRGWARTDSDGRFEFSTIRPGSYPSSRNPAHVHFTVFTADARYHAGEVQFDNDPLIGDTERSRERNSGEFGSIRPVRQQGNTEHVDFAIRLEERSRF